MIFSVRIPGRTSAFLLEISYAYKLIHAEQPLIIIIIIIHSLMEQSPS
jgi:hypothetical protein